MSVHDPEKAAPRPAAQAAAPSAAGRRLGLALLVIATAQLMLVLDDTIVNVALPDMQRSLHIPAPHLNWVASFYALAFGGLLLAGGRAGDLFGRLRMFRTGIIVFALASMAGGFAANGTALLAARIVQGCGAAIAAPGALSLLATTFPAGPARTRALGIYGAMAGLGSVAGLLLLAFVPIERASRAPVLPPRVIADRNRGGASAVMLLLGAGMLAMFYLLTLYMQLVRGYSAIHTGLAYLPVVAGALVALLTINARVSGAEAAGH
jgi:MFS family permease